jgi:hypothetical protein
VDVAASGLTVAAGMADAEIRLALVEGRGGGDWSGDAGVFSSAVAGALATGQFRTVGWIRADDGRVTFAFAAPGDTDLDGVVDVLDAANVMAGRRFDSGQAAIWSEGDFTHDGAFDVLDAAEFLSAGLFDAGGYLPSPLAVAPVPEPSGWLLGLAAGAAWMAATRLRTTPQSRERCGPADGSPAWPAPEAGGPAGSTAAGVGLIRRPMSEKTAELAGICADGGDPFQDASVVGVPIAENSADRRWASR